eukprot:scaffold248425_cov73-Cyclotella_meneghiniana.AAC.6
MLWTAYLLFLTTAAVSFAANCNVALNTDERTAGCFATESGDGTYVCDTTANWMHHVGGSSDWYPATPPKGTGIHDYVAYKGSSPCPNNGSCDGCASPSGEVVCSVKINPEDCSVDSGNLLESVTMQDSASKAFCTTKWACGLLVYAFVYLF